MRAIRAHFDGKNVIIPKDANGIPAGEVIVVFKDAREEVSDRDAWDKAQETAFEKAWTNDEDAVYDTM